MEIMNSDGTGTSALADHLAVVDRLLASLAPLAFGPPVTHVYNPLVYARDVYESYAGTYGSPVKEILFLGMNPGPWGMAQTGVPFGDVAAVSEWMGISGKVGLPDNPHPARPVAGFSCNRGEVSGRRLWGAARKRYPDPSAFFSRCFVANYCPLVFMEASGRNRTPDRLPAAERGPLFAACDRALGELVDILAPRYVVGVGAFAEKRARAALSGRRVVVGRITHPSPANPKANRGWEALAAGELAALGIRCGPKERGQGFQGPRVRG
jgi:single-strand selective monofunctional uracil DNA glycosylase